MTEVFKIGPYEKEVRDSSLGGEGYSEWRGIDTIEHLLLLGGEFRFSFKECLPTLAARFQSDAVLKILEGGCGYGELLTDLKGLQDDLGVKIHTTGVTMARRHIPKPRDEEFIIDRMIIGTVQKAYERGLLSGGYHLIVDFLGAVYYSRDDPTKPLTIYSNILIPGGMMLFRSFELISGIWGEIDYQKQRKRIEGLMEEGGLRIVKLTKSGDALVEKQISN